MSEKIHVFAIEGNIGVGKTTLMQKMMERFPDFGYCFEPIYEWQNVKCTDGTCINMLDKASRNPKKNAFSFQVMALSSQLKYLNTLGKFGSNIVITERSVLSNKHVFAMLLKNERIMSKNQWVSYNFVLKELLPSDFEYSGFIYLKTDPDTCLRRIRSRGRNEEQRLSLSYLNKIEKYYQSLLMKRDDILIVNNNDHVSEFDLVLAEVEMFIKKRIEVDVEKREKGMDNFVCCGKLDDFDVNS